VVVATDDDRIMETVRSFGGEAVMTSADHQSGTDRCVEALNKSEQASGKSFKVVVNIQGDEPFIQPEQLERLTGCFHNADTEIATLIKPLTSHEELFDPNRPKVVINNNAQALFFSRSPIPFYRNLPEEEWHLNHDYFLHIGIYAYRSDILREITLLERSSLETAESLEQLRWLQNGYIISTRKTDYESWGIDTPEDLELLKQKGIL
jgi:3-deoxy-manno-octulosonate cytidylyltransferase (CMP-KDO synthetase)